MAKSNRMNLSCVQNHIEFFSLKNLTYIQEWKILHVGSMSSISAIALRLPLPLPCNFSIHVKFPYRLCPKV